MENDPKAYESFMQMAADATILAEKGPEFLEQLLQETGTGAQRRGLVHLPQHALADCDVLVLLYFTPIPYRAEGLLLPATREKLDESL